MLLLISRAPNVLLYHVEGMDSKPKAKNLTIGDKVLIEETNSVVELLKKQKQVTVRKAMKSEESKYTKLVLVKDTKTEEGGNR